MLEAGKEMRERGPDIMAGMGNLQIKGSGEIFPVSEWPRKF